MPFKDSFTLCFLSQNDNIIKYLQKKTPFFFSAVHYQADLKNIYNINASVITA